MPKKNLLTLFYWYADTVIVPIDSGETNLLRVINSGLNQELFFTVANHKFTVVSADASYTKPFTTSVIMLGPGQTTDVLITGDQPPARYYMAARAYQSAQGAPFDNTTTTAILEYKSAPCPAKKGVSTTPVFPSLPAFNDTATVTAFSKSFRSPAKVEVPTDIDESLFFTVGLGLNRCPPKFKSSQCQGPNGTRFTASMNNVSFVLPSNFSLLQAHQQGIPGVFTTDYPAAPPVKFDYTGNVSRSLWQPVPGTKLYKLKYGSRVQVVLQGTSIFTAENHPIHLHGYDFYIIAEGFGNFNPSTDTSKFNLVDPPLRNTVAVPVNGWAVIRFVADNPGKITWISQNFYFQYISKFCPQLSIHLSGKNRSLANALPLGCSYHLGSGHGFPGGEWSWGFAIDRVSSSGFASVLRSSTEKPPTVELHMPYKRGTYFSTLSIRIIQCCFPRIWGLSSCFLFHCSFW